MKTPVLSAPRPTRLLVTLGVVCAALLAPGLRASATDDAAAIAALDTEFQAAVKRNDAATIARIQAEDMILVTGRGAVFTRADHVKAAQDRERTYEEQDEVPGTQTVRVWGNTAVVTALLWIKGTAKDGKAFDYKLWFSDTYARTPSGWKYVFGQASLPLPKA
ncbi:MAG TPA: nuclear transport factor 2 family protein [Lacunisphaera sp.]|nr:nuclear transport factor 2 family protein [Lacunisphaera sp.]